MVLVASTWGIIFFQRQINYTFQTYLFKPKNLEVEGRTLSRRYDTYNACFLSWSKGLRKVWNLSNSSSGWKSDYLLNRDILLHKPRNLIV